MLALLKRFFCLLSSHYKQAKSHILWLIFLDLYRTSWSPDLTELSKFLFTFQDLLRLGINLREINEVFGHHHLVFFLSPENFQSLLLQRYRCNKLIVLPVNCAVMSDCSVRIWSHKTPHRPHNLQMFGVSKLMWKIVLSFTQPRH